MGAILRRYATVDKTFAQPVVFAVVNSSVLALSVLLHFFNAQPYTFAVVTCADIALSVFYSVLTCCWIFLQLWTALTLHGCCAFLCLLTWSADNLYSLQSQIVQGVCVQ